MIDLLSQIDLGVSQLPHPLFVVIHLAILAVAIGFAVGMAKKGGPAKWTAGFSLVALAEVIYILYHLQVTHFLLSHTLAEVLVLVAMILFFTGWIARTRN